MLADGCCLVAVRPLVCLLSTHERSTVLSCIWAGAPSVGMLQAKAHLLLGTAAGHEFCQKLSQLLTLWLSHWPPEQVPDIELEDLHWLVAASCTQPELWTRLQHPASVGAAMVLGR